MLEQMKALGAIAGVLRDRSKLTQAADDVKRKLGEVRVEGRSPDGQVVVRANGRLEIQSVTLAPALAQSASTDAGRARAQELIAQACSDANAKAQEAAKGVISQHLKSMGLGDLSQLSGLTSGL